MDFHLPQHWFVKGFIRAGGIIDSWFDCYNISPIIGFNWWVHRGMCWEQLRSSWRKLSLTRCVFSWDFCFSASLFIYWVMIFHQILFARIYFFLICMGPEGIESKAWNHVPIYTLLILAVSWVFCHSK